MIIGRNIKGYPVAVAFDTFQSAQIAIKFDGGWENLSVSGASDLEDVDVVMRIAAAYIDGRIAKYQAANQARRINDAKRD